jgi:hypothetical protein
MVKLVDTVDSKSTTKVWGFDSLYPHQLGV